MNQKFSLKTSKFIFFISHNVNAEISLEHSETNSVIVSKENAIRDKFKSCVEKTQTLEKKIKRAGFETSIDHYKKNSCHLSDQHNKKS